MPKTTLTYFDFSASRGEECRLALHLAGIEFVDERLKLAEFKAKKDSFPFGALPVLSVEGHPPLAQSNAILRLIGVQHGMHPAEPWAAAREDAVMDAVEDLRNKMSPILRIKEEPEKLRIRTEAATGYLPEWARHVERQLGPIERGPFVGGGTLHVADLKLFTAIGAYLRGSIDHIPTDVFKGSPRLLAVYEAVKGHEKVKGWYAR